jgi:hypothetical protein
MKISKIHQNFANRFRVICITLVQDCLDYPERFLGQNWEEVINFWFYLETLSKDQLRVVRERYWDLSYEDQDRACKAAVDSASSYSYNVSMLKYAYSSVSHNVPYAHFGAYYATLELIGLQKLLDRGHQPIFFPMFLNT